MWLALLRGGVDDARLITVEACEVSMANGERIPTNGNPWERWVSLQLIRVERDLDRLQKKEIAQRNAQRNMVTLLDEHAKTMSLLVSAAKAVDRRIRGIDRRFDDHDRRFDHIDKQLAEVLKRLS